MDTPQSQIRPLDQALPAPLPRTAARPSARRPMRLSETIVSGIVRLTDALAIAGAAGLCYIAVLGGDAAAARAYLTEIAVTIVLTLGVFEYCRLYDFNTIVAWPSRMRQMVVLSAGLGLALAALALAFGIAGQFSRGWFLASFAGSAVAMFASRGLAKAAIRRLARQGALVRSMAIVGASGQAQHLVRRLGQQDTPWRRVIGIFDDRRTRIGQAIDGHPVLGNLDELVAYVRRGQVQDVVITLPWSADARLIDIIGRLRALPVHIYLGCDLIGYHFPRHREVRLQGVPVTEIASAPLTGWSGLVKTIEDKIVAGTLLVLLAPLLIALAVAIRADSAGPILFRQRRYGFNNEVIVIYKFRSMYHHRPAERGVPQATRADPRVTRVGRLLRRTSLDELPQLLNVLRGEMSLIGPRPHAVEHNEEYAKLIGGYHGRHKVKPGITGWAQVNGFRGETDTVDKMRARVEHDIHYIENWSVWFDAKILVMTALIGWTGRNAY